MIGFSKKALAGVQDCPYCLLNIGLFLIGGCRLLFCLTIWLVPFLEVTLQKHDFFFNPILPAYGLDFCSDGMNKMSILSHRQMRLIFKIKHLSSSDDNYSQSFFSLSLSRSRQWLCGSCYTIACCPVLGGWTAVGDHCFKEHTWAFIKRDLVNV